MRGCAGGQTNRTGEISYQQLNRTLESSYPKRSSHTEEEKIAKKQLNLGLKSIKQKQREYHNKWMKPGDGSLRK